MGLRPATSHEKLVLQNWWGGPPGPRGTPSSACRPPASCFCPSGGGRDRGAGPPAPEARCRANGISIRQSASRRTRASHADQGGPPTKPVFRPCPSERSSDLFGGASFSLLSPSADRTSSPRSPPPSCATSLLSILASLRKPTRNSLILRRSMSSAFECDLCLAAKLQNLR